MHVDFLRVQQSLSLANFPDSMCETIPVRPQAVLDQPGAGDVVRAGQKGIWKAQLCTGQCLRDERGFTCISFFGLLFDTGQDLCHSTADGCSSPCCWRKSSLRATQGLLGGSSERRCKGTGCAACDQAEAQRPDSALPRACRYS